jgi:hypothetical protein
MLLNMWYLLFCYCFSAYSCLYADSKQCSRNSLFHFLTYLLSKFMCSWLMNQKCQCINRLIHDIDDHFNNICFLKACKLIVKWTIAMSHRFQVVNKIYNYLRERQFILDNNLSIINNILWNKLPSFCLAQGFYAFIIVTREYDCRIYNWLFEIVRGIFIWCL